MNHAEPRTLHVLGFRILLDDSLGHIEVHHDGTITWDDLQAIKDQVWGRDVRAIEVYPASDDVVNTGNYRHLWRLGAGDFAPDLLGHNHGWYNRHSAESLEHRSWMAWYRAQEVFG